MKESLQTRPRRALVVFWLVGLGSITLLLLSTLRKSAGWEHYLKLYGVAVLWFVFIALVSGGRKFTQSNLIPKRADRAIIVIVLTLVFVVLLAHCLNALLQLQILPAALYALVLSGLFRAMRDLSKSP